VGVNPLWELDEIIRRRGKPRMIVSDTCKEFTSNAMPAWTTAGDVNWHFIASDCPTAACWQTARRGKPMQNGICEAFNGRWDTSRLQPMPKRSPQRMIDGATLTSSADHPLLNRRNRANLTKGPWR
jgi:transposase InsO family protein